MPRQHVCDIYIYAVCVVCNEAAEAQSAGGAPVNQDLHHAHVCGRAALLVPAAPAAGARVSA
jgi:hypothetical protein